MTSPLAVCSFFAIVFLSLQPLVLGFTINYAENCTLQAVPQFENKFRVVMMSSSPKDFFCANGTVFDQSSCSCINYDASGGAPMPTAPSRPVTRPSVDVVTADVTKLPYNPCDTFKPHADSGAYWHLDINRRIKRYCATGTLFNKVTCRCDIFSPIYKRECSPTVRIDFESNIRDELGKLHVDNYGTEIFKGLGKFNRQGKIQIPLYRRYYFGKEITIEFRFIDYAGGDLEQVLVSNCVKGVEPSIEIVSNFNDKTITFRLKTDGQPPKEIKLKYGLYWKHVIYTYDGSKFTASVNNQTQSVDAEGLIETRQAPLSIGQCLQNPNARGPRRAFVGYIDDIKIYHCVKRRFAPNGNTEP